MALCWYSTSKLRAPLPPLSECSFTLLTRVQSSPTYCDFSVVVDTPPSSDLFVRLDTLLMAQLVVQLEMYLHLRLEVGSTRLRQERRPRGYGAINYVGLLWYRASIWLGGLLSFT
jgi:hypothetical protein